MNENKTLYIKFPSVTRLQYPEDQCKAPTILYQTFANFKYICKNKILKTLKIDLLKQMSEFKIIRLPERHQIMNIRTMTVPPKRNSLQKELENSEDEPLQEAERLTKIFSVTKLNQLSKNSSPSDKQISPKKNLFNPKRKMTEDLRKTLFSKTVEFDCFEIFPQISKIIALTYGVEVINPHGNRIRKGKVQAGNNGFLVRQTIKKRVWWNAITEQCKKQDMDSVGFNLIWSEGEPSEKMKEKIKMNNEQCFEHIQNEFGSQNVINFQKNIYKIVNKLPKISQLLFTEWEERPKRLEEWIMKLQCLKKMNPEHLVVNNHLPNNIQITNKKLLYWNMQNYYEQRNMYPFDKIPKTYHLTRLNWQDTLKNIYHSPQDQLWILKPGEFTNRGRGITVFTSTKEALDFIVRHPPMNQEKTLLLQEYILPLLYNDRKFDIRCYMLAIEIDNCLKFYWYDEGYIRTASEKFTLKKSCKSIHLTNDAIQKNMKNYDKYEAANKLSYQELHRYCLKQTAFNFYDQILPAIKAIARDICHAVGDTHLIGAAQGFSFQIFGLDFLIDHLGKPWLCEVNTNPSLQICSSLLSRVIPEMIENSLRIVTDIFLPGPKTPAYAQHFLNNNKFSLIYSRMKENR